MLAHADLDLRLAVEAQGGVAISALAARLVAEDHLAFAAFDIDGGGAVPAIGVAFGEDEVGEEAAAGNEVPLNVLEGAGQMARAPGVVEAVEAADGGVEAAVEREFGHFAYLELRGGSIEASVVEHARREVDARHPVAFGGEGGGELTGAAAKVEEGGAGCKARTEMRVE